MRYDVVGVEGRVLLDAFWAHELEAGTFGAKVCYGFFLVFVAGDIVAEVGFHVFEGEGFVHWLMRMYNNLS